ncbi:MAG TPA: hypothetical protein VF344_03610 [Candidatus Limnocylindrales bacterium]
MPPAYPAYPAYPAAPASAPAPAARAPGIKVTPKLLAIAGIALAVVLAIVYVTMGSKSGSVTFAPSTFSCSSSVNVATVMRLPSSMSAAERLNWQIDGVTQITNLVAENFKQQADGTWLFTDTSAASSSCQGVSGPLSMGTHNVRILDANGHVLAEGSFTLTP